MIITPKKEPAPIPIVGRTRFTRLSLLDKVLLYSYAT